MASSTSSIIESQILHTTTARTLHANNFAKSSTQATHALTNVLSRYLALLAGTCAQYAQHAGRTGVNVRDALAALEEIGVGVDELREYVEGEARDLVRYTGQTARRAEELAELKSRLAEGLKQDHSDAVQLMYVPVPDFDVDLSQPSSPEDDDETQVDLAEEISAPVDVARPLDPYTDLVTPPSSPHLPPSPVSPPARKRARTSNWTAPEHIPDFLPPFPGHASSPLGSPSHQPVLPVPQHSESVPLHTESTELAPIHTEPTELNVPLSLSIPSLSITTAPSGSQPDSEPERKLQPQPPPRPSSPAIPTSISPMSSSYLTSIPYEHSSLASVPEWHLPNPPPVVSPPAATSTLPALLSSHSYLQSSSLSAPSLQPPNPLRHGLAMMLLGISSRAYSPAATLFASSNTNTCTPLPRRAAPLATHAVPLDKLGRASFNVGSERDKLPVPPADWHSRSAAGPVAIVDSTAVQGSRIATLARTVLPAPVIARATRLIPPPPLERNDQKLLYGPPVPAPWNSASGANAGEGKGGKGTKSKEEEDDEEDRVLSDAHLFATWDYDPKDFGAGLPIGRRGSKMGSANGMTTPQLKRKRSDGTAPPRRASEAGPAMIRIKTER